MIAAIIDRLDRGNVCPATVHMIHSLLGLSEQRESHDAGRPTVRSRQNTDTGSQTQRNSATRAGNEVAE